MSESPPRSLQEIPGLGPIRIRALQKAGYSNLSLLKAADVQSLSGVPGLTLQKAQALHLFLSQFDSLPKTEPISEILTGPTLVSSADSNRLQIALAQVMSRAIKLLLSPQAPDFRPRLLKSLERLSTRLEALAMDAASVPAPDSKKISAWLQTLSAEFPVDRPKDAADRKIQAKLSEMVDSLCDQLVTMESEASH